MKKIAVLMLPLLLAVGCARVGTNEVGVKTVYLSFLGKTGVQETVYETGYHIYVPPVSGFTVLSKNEQKLEMTQKEGEGSRPGQDDLKLKTTDGNNIWVDVTISWRVIPDRAYLVVRNVGESIDEIQAIAVRPIVRGVLRYALGKLSAESFYDATKRESQVTEARKLLNEQLNPLGLQVTDVLVNDYRFAPRYQKAIEDRKLYDQKKSEYESLTRAAEEDVKRRVFDARAEANRFIEEAKGELDQATLKGDAALYAAQRQAEAVLAEKTAEAGALEKLNKALSGSGGLNVVARRMAEALKGKEITIVPMTDNGALSVLDINRFLSNVAAVKAVQKTMPEEKIEPAVPQKIEEQKEPKAEKPEETPKPKSEGK